MKLSSMLEGYWLDKRLNLSKNSQEKYRYFFQMFIKFLGDIAVEDITSDDVRGWLDHLHTKRGLSRRSVHDGWAVISSFFSWAEKELQIPHVIRGRIDAPEFTERHIDPFTKDDVQRLLQAVEVGQEWEARNGKMVQSRRPTADRDRAILLTLLDSGIRASELCALAVKDYDAKRGRLHIRKGKGDKERFAIVGQRAMKAIWRYLADREHKRRDDPLFATRTGNHMHRETLYHMIQKIGERADVPNSHPHRFRHTFAINFFRNGGNIYLLKELLGHESLEMVMRYARLAEQDIDAGQEFSPADNWKL